MSEQLPPHPQTQDDPILELGKMLAARIPELDPRNLPDPVEIRGTPPLRHLYVIPQEVSLPWHNRPAGHLIRLSSDEVQQRLSQAEAFLQSID